jgi:arylsulfatase A-like enzyme
MGTDAVEHIVKIFKRTNLRQLTGCNQTVDDSDPLATGVAPVISTDFYPTILEMAGLPSKSSQHLDGVSLVPLLRGGGKIGRDAIYWHYPHYSNQGGFPGGAVRMGDWKLIERFEDGCVHLYNLEQDIGERKDLALEYPQRVRRMREKLHVWYKQVDAKFLQPKGDYQRPWRPQ